jgi:radical SAM superfamily enzyme YgiQ (UPF0313 family)
VIDEIDFAVNELEAGFIDFEDENLSLEPGWFLELLKRIRQRFGRHDLELRAMNGLFPPSLTAETVAAMKSAGFKKLNLSLGSTSRRQLDRFQRPQVITAFDDCLNWAAAQGLESVGYIIIGGPGQTAESSVADLVFLARRRVLAGLSVFYPAPGSRDYRNCQKLGLLPSTFMAMRASAFPVEHSTTREQAATLMRLGRVVNFMKHLIDTGAGIPNASPLPAKALDPSDRITIGRRLLAAFFEDGIIRGVTSEGEIYPHHTCLQTTEMFIDKLRGSRTHGSC